MKKSLESFKSFFDGDSGFDTRSVYVQAWEQGLAESASKKIQRIVTFSADQFTAQIAKQAGEQGVESIEVDFDKDNREMAVVFPKCVVSYQVPNLYSTAKDKLFSALLAENNESGLVSAIKSMPMLKQEEKVLENGGQEDELVFASDEGDSLQKIATELEKLTSLANNDLEAYQIEQAAAQLRELNSDEDGNEEF